MHRVRAPVELLRIGQIQQQFDFVLRFNELSLRMIMQTGADAVLRTNIAQVIVKLACPADVLPFQHLVYAARRKRYQFGSPEALQELTCLSCRFVDLRMPGRLIGRSEEHTSELQSHSFISYA